MQHGIDQGYWKAGDLIGDPFAGIGCGGVVCASKRLRWVGVELEDNFVRLARENFELHRRTWEEFGDPLPAILCGDSRAFASIVGEQLTAAITSPPFGPAQTGAGIAKEGVVRRPNGSTHQLGNDGYNRERHGDSPGQIGSLPAGNLDAAITSPPYAESVKGDHGEQETAQESQDKRQTPGGSLGKSQRSGGYGVSEGQIGALPAGDVDAIVTSPPFLGARAGTTKSNPTQGGGPCANRVRSVGTDGDCMGDTPGQIGSLPAGQAPCCRCGDCCRHGGTCIVRGWYNMAEDFRAICELLGSDNLCDGLRGRETEAWWPRFMSGVCTSPGQIGALKEGSIDGAITSPPYEESIHDAGNINWEQQPTEVQAKHGNKGYCGQLQKAGKGYGLSEGQIGCESGCTYWEACGQVYRQMWLALKPGGVAAVVLKDYIKNKQRVPLCDDTYRLLESIGFEVFERTRCWLVKTTVEPSLFGGEIKTTKSRKSFFRRLAEKKGSPRIDWEETIWARRREGNA